MEQEESCGGSGQALFTGSSLPSAPEQRRGKNNYKKKGERGG